MRLSFKLEPESTRMHQPLIVRNVFHDLIPHLLWPLSWHTHVICDKSLRPRSVFDQVVRLRSKERLVLQKVLHIVTMNRLYAAVPSDQIRTNPDLIFAWRTLFGRFKVILFVKLSDPNNAR